MIQQGTISSNPTEILKDLVVVKFSEEGSRHKPAEAATWIHFVDFLMNVLVRVVIGYKLLQVYVCKGPGP